MSGYGLLEKRLARALDAAPGIRNIVKSVYQRVNYIRHHQADFQYELNGPFAIQTPDEWAGVAGGPSGADTVYFGYYDKSPWSRNMRYMAYHRLRRDGEAEICAVDKQAGTMKVLAATQAYNHQQGSMTQWLPDDRLIFNTLDGRELVSCIVTTDGEKEIVPWPIQTVHPDGREALTLNYKRIDRLRAEYGYPMPVSNYGPHMPDSADGIWRIDLAAKRSDLLLSIEQLRRMQPRPEMERSEHKVNHIMYSPSGARYVFMHRWIGAQGKFSRLYAGTTDGKEPKLLLDDRMVSHYQWRDDEHLLAWARTAADGDRYYAINVMTGKLAIIGKDELDRFGDGHPSYSPDKRWIVTDTYPDKARQRHLMLYDTAEHKLVKVGRFFSPWKFDGAVRCDLHPRWSPDGRWLSIDSAHDGTRKTYCIDVSAVTRGGE